MVLFNWYDKLLSETFASLTVVSGEKLRCKINIKDKFVCKHFYLHGKCRQLQAGSRLNHSLKAFVAKALVF